MDWFSCFYGCPHIRVGSQEFSGDEPDRTDLMRWYEWDCIHCDFNFLNLSVRELHAESPELEREPSKASDWEAVRSEALMAADWRNLGAALWYSLLPTDGPIYHTASKQHNSSTELKKSFEKDLPLQSHNDADEDEDEDTEEGGAKLRFLWSIHEFGHGPRIVVILVIGSSQLDLLAQPCIYEYIFVV